jgi:hypothetical protein
MRRILRGTALCTAVVGVTLLSGAIAAGSPKPACAVTGVWELTGVTTNGKPAPLEGYRQRKVVSKKHFMWVGQAGRRDTLPLKTAADTLRHNQLSGGGGTWSLAGRAYTEHIEYFNDPTWIGRDWKATCRTEGDGWIHSFEVPSTSDTSRSAPRDTVIEAWHRIE